MASTMIVDLDGFTTETDPQGSPKFKLQELENYFSGPPVRTRLVDIPLGDGAFNPGRSWRGAKRMNLIGWAYGTTADQAEELAWERISALSPRGYGMTMTVTTPRGVRTLRVWLDNGTPQVLPYSKTSARFRVPVVAVDPRKYGPLVTDAATPGGGAEDGLTFPLFAGGYLDFGAFSPSGLFYVPNEGTAESWIRFRVRGSIADGIEIVAGSSTVVYEASVAVGTEVFLSPYAGGRATIGSSDVTANLTVTGGWPSVLGSVDGSSLQQVIVNPLGATDANALVTWEINPAWW